ncbi:MAG: response regulator, partial [Planctomycetales bacterium]|nr:response regulator [Planctomycetales bacterium]
MVVDDDRSIRHLITETFADTPYEIQAVGSVNDAIAQMQSEPPDVVLLDIRLPDDSGLEAFSRF